MPPTVRDSFLALTKRRYTEPYFVPRVPQAVRTRSLTEKELSAYEMQILRAKGTDVDARVEDARRRLVIVTLVDAETLELVFQPTDIAFLEDVDSQATAVPYSVAETHIPIRRSDIEDLVKNSSPTPEKSQPTS